MRFSSAWVKNEELTLMMGVGLVVLGGFWMLLDGPRMPLIFYINAGLQFL
jgi:hypothetical protein